jgi:predicted Fe-Mo cluster-binding NifX family protein
MMKIAIPEHQGRVAPVFDTCRRILFFMQEDDRQAMVAQEDWSGLAAPVRSVRLKQCEVDVLLCGAISCGIEDHVHRQGIRLIAWLAGELPEILSAFRAGTIMEPCYAMPGTLVCRRRRQMRLGTRGLKHRPAGCGAGRQDGRTD